MKRGAYAEGLTYSDIISEYPPGMKIRKDVANFVSLSIRALIDPLCRDGIDMLGDPHKHKKASKHCECEDFRHLPTC